MFRAFRRRDRCFPTQHPVPVRVLRVPSAGQNPHRLVRRWRVQCRSSLFRLVRVYLFPVQDCRPVRQQRSVPVR